MCRVRSHERTRIFLFVFLFGCCYFRGALSSLLSAADEAARIIGCNVINDNVIKYYFWVVERAWQFPLCVVTISICNLLLITFADFVFQINTHTHTFRPNSVISWHLNVSILTT